MAVNGVEIIEGSEWVTKDGRSGRITRNDNDKTYCWWLTLDNGVSRSYTAYGDYLAGEYREQDLSHPVSNTLTDNQNYTVEEIKKVYVSLGWSDACILIVINKLQELKDLEYAEYLRLKNKFDTDKD